MITPKKIVLFVFVLFLILVCLYFWKEIGFLIKPPALEVSQPPTDIIVNQEKFELIGKTNPFAVVSIKGEAAYVDKDGNFKKEILLSIGQNSVKIEAKNRFGKVKSIVRIIIYNQ